MIKNLLILVFGLVGFQAANAQRDTVIYYYKNSGKTVPVKDGADFYRVILPPDTAADKDLYRVYDYNLNGKLKSVATSLNAQAEVALDGTRIDYFPNGKRKRTSFYKNGVLNGTLTYYYPNGKLYYVLKIENVNNGNYDEYYHGYFLNPIYNYKMTLLEFRDSTGNLMASNGNGHIILFDEDFKKIIAEGNLKKDKKDGEWKGLIADSGKFTCVFHKGDVVSGVSYLNSGNQYSFDQLYVPAEFSGGIEAFHDFIRRKLRYPESARSHKVVGYVEVGFDIEADGKVSNVKVTQSLLKSCDDEAIRVVSTSPVWTPGRKFGIPSMTHNKVSVYFMNH
jgi:TonB family protein